MEITLSTFLVEKISSFFHLSANENIKCDPIQRYYREIEDLLKLLKPVLDALTDAEFPSDEKLRKAFTGLGQSVEELRELFDACQLLMSKVYFVLQVESLAMKVQTSVLEIFDLLKSCDQHVLGELSSASLEIYAQKVQHLDFEQQSANITQAIQDQVDRSGAKSDDLTKIATSLSLNSNQELLIEAVALERLKENAEQADDNGEAEYFDQMIVLVNHMLNNFVASKQSQSHSPVPIPPDYCCPLSLELMTDPVIVSSGQTYERSFIRDWIDLGLTFCPKTRQTLAHTTLIPNYTVKALIAYWCDTHNVKLPEPISSDHSALPDSNAPLTPPRRSATSLTGIEDEESPPDHLRISHEESLHVDGTRDESDTVSLAEEAVSLGHNRSTSASSIHSNSHVSQGVSGEDNNNTVVSESVANGSDVSEDSQPTANLNTREREPEFPFRNRAIWRRPLVDRFIPRIISTAANETAADLSGVEAQVKTLVEQLKSTSLDEQRSASNEIRQLAKHNSDNRIVIANCGAIDLLVSLLNSTDSMIQENAVTALLNLSLNDNNKSAIGNANAIEPLIHVLQTGSPEAKENSAATLFSLSVMDENKAKIGRAGAIKPLVDLLGNGTPRGKKDAATALFNLSLFHEHKARIVQDGAVKYLVELMDPAAGMVDKAVAVLSNLSTIQEGRNAIGQEGGIPVLIDVVELGSARGKEHAAAALLQLCVGSNRFCNMVLQEGAVPPLVALSQTGTPRAKEKAQSLLSCFRNHRHGNTARS